MAGNLDDGCNDESWLEDYSDSKLENIYHISIRKKPILIRQLPSSDGVHISSPNKSLEDNDDEPRGISHSEGDLADVSMLVCPSDLSIFSDKEAHDKDQSSHLCYNGGAGSSPYSLSKTNSNSRSKSSDSLLFQTRPRSNSCVTISSIDTLNASIIACPPTPRIPTVWTGDASSQESRNSPLLKPRAIPHIDPSLPSPLPNFDLSNGSSERCAWLDDYIRRKSRRQTGQPRFLFSKVARMLRNGINTGRFDFSADLNGPKNTGYRTNVGFSSQSMVPIKIRIRSLHRSNSVDSCLSSHFSRSRSDSIRTILVTQGFEIETPPAPSPQSQVKKSLLSRVKSSRKPKVRRNTNN
jgi:hypothetical protein